MTKQIEVLTITPTGKERRTIVKNRREAGQIVAYTIADNTRTDRKTCTAIAMDAEKTGRASWLGYFFIIGPAEATQ